MQGPMFFLAALVSSASIASAAVAEVPRGLQLGSLECNVARVQILADLASTRSAVNKISDQDVQSAASQGLDTARSGILKIAGALITGQTAPQEDRDEVASGLNATAQALASSTNNDTDVANAQKELSKAAAAGKSVVLNC
ncbi:hypothetical protein TD95_004594 [Thielaviopsis punctulata]|uniref:Cell wall protein n=1 Tax=Thielaviopsis punctulata TaxID=72032 RepID=A0A0F4ZKC2_9PEZI|nr:hypothetical protein TD95_004594 [Thielaviopsis punctulata]